MKALPGPRVVRERVDMLATENDDWQLWAIVWFLAFAFVVLFGSWWHFKEVRRLQQYAEGSFQAGMDTAAGICASAITNREVSK